MKVKKFVQAMDSLSDNITKVPVILTDKKSYSISSINYSQNSIVKLVAGSIAMDIDEFNKITTKLCVIRPNATIVVDIEDIYHIQNVAFGIDNINIITGGKVKK